MYILSNSADLSYMTLNDFIAGNAYKIFYSEFARHIEAALEQLHAGTPLLKDDLRGLSGRFHTIKGGAGFFGLTEIVTLSRTLEDAFKEEEALSAELRRELTSIVERLREEGSKMPPPQTKG